LHIGPETIQTIQIGNEGLILRRALEIEAAYAPRERREKFRAPNGERMRGGTAHVEGGNAETKTAKPEQVRTSAAEMPDMAPAETTGEVSLLPALIEMIVNVAAAGIVANPLAVGIHLQSHRSQVVPHSSAEAVQWETAFCTARGASLTP